MPVLPEELYARCWDHWGETLRTRETPEMHIVRGQADNMIKMPIPYFGNIRAFMQLPRNRRIITVAANPNKNTQPSLVMVQARLNADQTEERLSGYFVQRRIGAPRWRGWFSNYENILNGLEMSYWSEDYPALHTDMYSPIATDPTWGDLGPEDKEYFKQAGIPIFFELLSLLDPRLIIVSLARGAMDDLHNRLADSWGERRMMDTLCTFEEYGNGDPRDPPFEVHWKTFTKKGGEKISVVSGASMRGRPFGSISSEQRQRIGEFCKQRLA